MKSNSYRTLVLWLPVSIISDGTMGLEDERKLMINERLMKIIGLHQLLRPGGPKTYGLNTFGWVAVAETVWLVAVLCVLIISAYYAFDSVNKFVEYAQMIVMDAMAIFIQYRMVRYSDTLWTCLQWTRTDCLSYGRHRTRTLDVSRAKSKSLSLVACTFTVLIVLLWDLGPFFNWGQFTEIRFKGTDTPTRYRMNILNFIFPIANEYSYDSYFAATYLVEFVTLVVWSHVTITFDVLIISLCVAVADQLKTVADSFAELSAVRESSVSSKSRLTGLT